MSVFDPDHDSDTKALHEVPCPGCGCEPDVVDYFVDTETRRRRGYGCSCGQLVIDGVAIRGGYRK